MPRSNRRRTITRSHAGRQQMTALVPISNGRCKAHTKAGHRCKNPSTQKGYCGIHNPTQCSGMTKNRSRCKNSALHHGHCATHYRQNPAAIKKFGIAMGRAAKKTGQGIVKGAKYAGRKSYKAGAIGKDRASVGLANNRVKSLQKCAKELDVGKSQLEATREMKKARRAVSDAEAKLAKTRKDVAHLNPRRRSNSSYNFVSAHSNAAQRKKYVASMKRKVKSIQKKIMDMGDYEKIADEISNLDFFAYDRYIDEKEVMKAKKDLKKLNEALKKARFEAGQMRLMDSINEKQKAAHRGRGEYKPRRYLNSRRRNSSQWSMDSFVQEVADSLQLAANNRNGGAFTQNLGYVPATAKKAGTLYILGENSSPPKGWINLMGYRGMPHASLTKKLRSLLGRIPILPWYGGQKMPEVKIKSNPRRRKKNPLKGRGISTANPHHPRKHHHWDHPLNHIQWVGHPENPIVVKVVNAEFKVGRTPVRVIPTNPYYIGMSDKPIGRHRPLTQVDDMREFVEVVRDSTTSRREVPYATKEKVYKMVLDELKRYKKSIQHKLNPRRRRR